jgi:putative Holliday junction resolvase
MPRRRGSPTCSPVGERTDQTELSGAAGLTPRPRGPGRAIAVDLGERRIGIAVSDSARVLAQPNTVIVRSGDRDRDHSAIAAVVEEYRATVVVVGLPVSLSGRIGPAARRAVEESDALGRRLPVPVVLFDERLSTVEATRRLRDARARPARSPSSKRRAVVDDLAAAVFLQAWIDAGAPGEVVP